MRAGSLCTGYGGLDRAVHEVLGGELAWLADNDEGAAKILAHRYPDVPNLGDITAVDWSAVEPVDVLTAGFPCQDISCAGRRAGLREGNRSGLWLHVARAIAELRPPLVVIENVKELLSERADSDMESCAWCMGDTSAESAMRALGAVLADLAEIGFDAEWVSVPAASAGACHLRWRVFILAWPAADADSPDAGPRPRGSREAPPAGAGNGPERRRVSRLGISSSAPEDADRPVGGERRQSASGQAARGRPRADTGGSGGARAIADACREGLEVGTVEHHGPERPAAERGRGDAAADAGGGRPLADPPSHGRNEGRPEPTGIIGRPDAAECGHAPAADAERGGRDGRPQEPQRGPEWGVAATWHRPGAFGRYEAAVRRHERAFRLLVPAPVAPGRGGDPRLSPTFTEWMMGLPEGWVTDVPGLSRNAQLKALGNGVVPQQAAMALRLLLDRADIPALVATEGAA